MTCRRVVGYEACAAVATISTDGTILRGWRLGTLVAEATENHIVARIHSATRYQSLENGLDETGAGGAGSTHCKGRSKPGAHRDPISPLRGWRECVHCRLTPASVAMNSTHSATHHDCQLSERSGTSLIAGRIGPSGQPDAAGYRHCMDRLDPRSARHGSRQAARRAGQADPNRLRMRPGAKHRFHGDTQTSRTSPISTMPPGDAIKPRPTQLPRYVEKP